MTSNRPININGTPNSLWIDNDYIEMSNISDWSWIRNIYFTPTGGTTVVNLQDYVNKRAGDSGEGLFAMVRNSSDGLYWDDSYHVLAYSSGSLNYQEWNGVFTTTGSFGNTNISTSGITKTNYSDWSWLTIEYRSGGTTVTENLQDYLDFRCLPEANSENIGAIPSVHYTTELGYHWEESGFGINYSTNIMEAPVFGGYSAANTSTTFKLDGTGLNSSAHSNWSWISRLSGNNKVTLQDTLDTKAPLASPALTGTPTAPTAATNTNNTQIATTAFVKSVLPTVNNATLTIQKNGTNVNTFTANSSSNVTANIQVNELPTVTASDNGKILRVVSGAWSLVNPNVIYSGSGTPSNSIGNDGDIYLQS